MNAFLATVRGVYFIATVALFGELAFRVLVERAVLHRMPGESADAWRALRQRSVILLVALASAIVSCVLWLLAQVQVMSGMPLRDLNQNTLQSALFDTEFGRVSLIRLGLAIAFGIAFALLRRDKRTTILTTGAGVIALGLLISVAWTSHANGERGQDRMVHLLADVMHLAATGTWLGMLPALAFTILSARRDASRGALQWAALAARRFSAFGVAAVSTLVLTGIVNAWFTVGSLPAMLGTDYGRLLSFKLSLFGAMLALAAMNKFRYTPQLWQSASGSRVVTSCGAIRRLGRNTVGEIALGVTVLCIVGALGTATPGAHQQTLWPFAYTLDSALAREHARAIALCLVAAAAAAILAAGARRYRLLALTCVAGGAAIGALFLLWFLAAPANPTTYFRSPVRYSAQSIADGAQAYAEQCSICHGAQGRGDGPAAAALSVRPADLIEHVLHHREGDVLWWIKRGIPGTPMPAFDRKIPKHRMWDVINLLRARAEAEESKSMGSAVRSLAAKAPDFAFQIDREQLESLADARGRRSVLFILFDPSESSDRLHALLQAQGELQQAGLRIIAMPRRASASAHRQAAEAAVIAHFEPRVVSAYTIFAPRISERQDRSELRHIEFLIDRQGYIRARWTPGDGQEWLQVPYLIAQVRATEREKPRSLVGDEGEHAHH